MRRNPAQLMINEQLAEKLDQYALLTDADFSD